MHESCFGVAAIFSLFHIGCFIYGCYVHIGYYFPFVKEIFCEGSVVYNLRNNNEFLPLRVRAVGCGTETIKYTVQRLWVTLPQHIGNTQSINEFKTHIKN